MNRASSPASAARSATHAGVSSWSPSPISSRRSAANRCAHCSGPATTLACRETEIPSRRRRAAELVAQLLRQPRVGEEVHHRPAREIALVEVQQRERLAPERTLRKRRALVQVHGDPGLDEHGLHQRPIRLAVTVGDRHLPEPGPLLRPLKTRRAAARTSRAGSGADTSRIVSSGSIAGFAGAVNSERRIRCSAAPGPATPGAASSAAPNDRRRRRSSASGASAAAGTLGRYTSTGIRAAIETSSRSSAGAISSTPRRGGPSHPSARDQPPAERRRGRRSRPDAPRTRPGSPPAIRPSPARPLHPRAGRRGPRRRSRRPSAPAPTGTALGEPRRLGDRREISPMERATSASSTRSANGGRARRPAATSEGAPR